MPVSTHHSNHNIIVKIIFLIIFLMRHYTFLPSEGCTLSTSTQTCRQWPTKECNQSSSSSSFPSQIFWNCADFFKFENFPSDPGWPGGPGRTSTTTTASTRCSPYLQCRPARAGSRKFSLLPFLNVFFDKRCFAGSFKTRCRQHTRTKDQSHGTELSIPSSTSSSSSSFHSSSSTSSSP